MADHDSSRSHRHKIRRHYEPRITPGRASYDILDWASPQSQRARFEVLVRHVELAGRSLLDVGCGLGDLLGFLRERNIDVRYTGVDILDKMVAAARDRHTGGQFIQADIFDPGPPPGLHPRGMGVPPMSGTGVSPVSGMGVPPMRLEGVPPSRTVENGQDLPIGTSATGETPVGHMGGTPMPRENPPPIFGPASFDVTFCSGAFNLNLGNNEQFLPRAVAEMVRLARHAAVFNLLHHRTPHQDGTYFYFDPKNIPTLTAGLDVTVQIIDDYLPNDFTVICRKR